jgi:hypothetical protein
VNFDGTTVAPTIRASGNVSSITRNGVGDYTINFSAAMPDTNYNSVGMTGGTLFAWIIRDFSDGTPKSTSSMRVATADNTINPINPAVVCVSVFR